MLWLGMPDDDDVLQYRVGSECSGMPVSVNQYACLNISPRVRFCFTTFHDVVAHVNIECPFSPEWRHNAHHHYRTTHAPLSPEFAWVNRNGTRRVSQRQRNMSVTIIIRGAQRNAWHDLTVTGVHAEPYLQGRRRNADAHASMKWQVTIFCGQ